MRGRRVGPYELIAELGSGGLGQVWRARDAAGREVALKLLLRDAHDLRAEERERFLREGAALLRVRDPGLVALVDHGLQEPVPWLAMELIPGETLAVRLRAGPLAPTRALQIALEIGRTLARLHATGVIHRDLKPHNVMLRPTPDGGERAVLLDLGLARLVDLRAQLTRTGELVGTPGYMSPEQAAGEPVGTATDVYGLGAVLYALLCGGPPFQGTPIEVISAVLTREPPPPSRRRPGLDPALDELVVRCLRKAPADRPELAPLCQELARLGRTPEGGAQRPRGRRPALVAASLLTIGSAVGGGVWLGYRPRPDAPGEAPPPAAPLTPVSRAALARHRSEELIERARVARDRGDAAEACLLLEEAVSSDPEHAYAWYALGLARAQVGSGQEALEALDRALSLNPRDGKAWFQRSLTCVDLGDRAEARRSLDRALEADPLLPRAWSVRALLRGSMGDPDGAAADLQRALEVGRNDADVLHDQGLYLFSRGDMDGALRAWDAALGCDPDQVQTLQQRAALSGRLGRLSEARADLDRLVQLQPREAKNWHDRAVVRWRLQDTAGAGEDYAHALQLDPMLATAWWGHAKASVVAGDYRSAAEDYRRYLELAPDGPGAAEAREFLTQLQEAARQGG